jgi:hypothetical protein
MNLCAVKGPIIFENMLDFYSIGNYTKHQNEQLCLEDGERDLKVIFGARCMVSPDARTQEKQNASGGGKNLLTCFDGEGIFLVFNDIRFGQPIVGMFLGYGRKML